MCVHAQNRVLPNVFNNGNLATRLIWTRVTSSNADLVQLTNSYLVVAALSVKKSVITVYTLTAEREAGIDEEP